MTRKPVGLQLDTVTAALASCQPALKATDVGDKYVIQGRFHVHERITGAPTDPPISIYEVEIWLFPEFPDTEPRVFEIGRRIPRDLDRHMFSDGGCCVTVWEAWLATAPRTSFEAFLNGPLREFFLSQFWYELNGEWPFGEWSHGMKGLEEAYAAVLRVPSEGRRVRAYLDVLSRQRPKMRRPCPCGSGRRLRDCHCKEIMALHQQIPPPLAARMWRRVRH